MLVQYVAVLVGICRSLAEESSDCGIPLIDGPSKVRDSQLSASSSHDAKHNPARSRLHTVSSATGWGAWCPRTHNDQQWIQVDFHKLVHVTSITTQGRQDHDSWVTSYVVQYSTEAKGGWTAYTEKGKTKTFLGNFDRHSVHDHILSQPFDARRIRLRPKTWHANVCMRWEVYGCYLPGLSATCPYGYEHVFSHGYPQAVEGKPYHPSCYSFIRVPANWLDARKRCLAHGGDLVSIETPGEQYHLDHLIKSNPNLQQPAIPGVPYAGYWTSGTDVLSESNWKWAATGRTLGYKNWLSAQPNNSGPDKDCLVLEPGNQRWNHLQCSSMWPLSICEKKALIPLA